MKFCSVVPEICSGHGHVAKKERIIIIIIRFRSSGALLVEVWICTTMALQNLQQYGCQTGNKLKEKSRDLNRNSSRNKNETMLGSGYANCPEFGVLCGVIFKLDIL